MMKHGLSPVEWLKGMRLATPSKLQGLTLIVSATPKYITSAYYYLPKILGTNQLNFLSYPNLILLSFPFLIGQQNRYSGCIAYLLGLWLPIGLVICLIFLISPESTLNESWSLLWIRHSLVSLAPFPFQYLDQNCLIVVIQVCLLNTEMALETKLA